MTTRRHLVTTAGAIATGSIAARLARLEQRLPRSDGSVRERDGDPIVVTVEDEGPGIAPENLNKVFDRFFTERPPEHGFGRNSGLGLAITKQIVERHGGRIRAENRMAGGPDDGDEGRIAGARFIVELPVTS